MSRNRRAARGDTRTVITARGPADLVAAVPYLVGFVPSSSVVLISLRGPRLRFGLVARLDLPDVGSEVEAARAISEMIRRDGPREVVVLVYDDAGWRPDRRPHQSLVDAVGAELAGHDIALRDAIYVTPQRFWSISCPDDACCPDAGWALRDAISSPVAATYVLHGRAPLPDRRALSDRVAPLGPIMLAAVGAAADTAVDAIGPSWGDERSLPLLSWQRASVALFDELARRYAGGARDLSVSEAGRLIAGLADTAVRDVVATRWTRWWQALPDSGAPDDEMARHTGHLSAGPVGVDLEDPAVTEGVEQLFVDLARRGQGPQVLGPLTVLAMHSWALGNGAFAGVAIDRALSIDPAYRMAGLVDTLLRAGLAPRWVAAVRAADERLPPRRPSQGMR